MLGKVDSWQFNAFSLHEVSGGRPLSMLSFFLFKRFEVGQGLLRYEGGWWLPLFCSVKGERDLSSHLVITPFPFPFSARPQLIDKFQLDEVKLVQFLMRVEDGYPSNPYHNRIHAADVLQSLHVLLCRGGLMQTGMCDESTLTACYLSAVRGARGAREQGRSRWADRSTCTLRRLSRRCLGLSQGKGA